MTRGRWSPQHVYIEKGCFSASSRKHSSHQLQILEHCAPIVPAGGAQDRASHRQRSWPVAPGHPVEKHSASVPACMPRQRIEVVLRTSHVDQIERRHEAGKRFAIVPDIVVGDDQPLAGGEADPGQHVSYFSHGGHQLRIGCYVADQISPLPCVSRENLAGRCVHHHNLSQCGRKPPQIFGEVGAQKRARGLDGENVGGFHRNRGHFCGKGQHACRLRGASRSRLATQ